MTCKFSQLLRIYCKIITKSIVCLFLFVLPGECKETELLLVFFKLEYFFLHGFWDFSYTTVVRLVGSLKLMSFGNKKFFRHELVFTVQFQSMIETIDMHRGFDNTIMDTFQGFLPLQVGHVFQICLAIDIHAPAHALNTSHRRGSHHAALALLIDVPLGTRSHGH